MADREFELHILGRTIEHLGTQMYKHRAPSIAELVANCWDAGAHKVRIDLPQQADYDPSTSVIVVMDDGEGMDAAAIQDRYLVVGLNRRTSGGELNHGRRVMGRKGIGKLAGFGLAERVTVTTWAAAPKAIRFSMSLKELKGDAGKPHAVRFPWEQVDRQPDWPDSGTRIELSLLRHSSPVNAEALAETLARRFSRTTRGAMKISINGVPLQEPEIETMYAYPDDGSLAEEKLSDGNVVRFSYRFAKKPIRSKELQGFVILANERTAQAPPFFFNVESTASSQHSTRYVTGEIVADYLDAGVDDETDVTSTDRQELDWEKAELAPLKEWGEEFSRRVLRECAEKRGERLENWVLSAPEFRTRLELLGPTERREISRFLTILGQKAEEDDPRTRDLSDSLIRAYEFRTFHDVIDDLDEVADDPEKLEEALARLHDWKVLESRAILEIVRGRISIVDRLEHMILANIPETASSVTSDNLHDLLAEYPWLFNPDWQVFAEEKSVSKQLREWDVRDCSGDMKKKRVDFLAFSTGTDALVIIELKRPGNAVELVEVQRLERYQAELMRARGDCRRVLIYGGAVNIPERKWEEIKAAQYFEALTWAEMFKRAKAFYSHYEAVLNGDVASSGFRVKEVEVARTRKILASGTAHRSEEDRRRGLGDSNT